MVDPQFDLGSAGALELLELWALCEVLGRPPDAPWARRALKQVRACVGFASVFLDLSSAEPEPSCQVYQMSRSAKAREACAVGPNARQSGQRGQAKQAAEAGPASRVCGPQRRRRSPRGCAGLRCGAQVAARAHELGAEQVAGAVALAAGLHRRLQQDQQQQQQQQREAATGAAEAGGGGGLGSEEELGVWLDVMALRRVCDRGARHAVAFGEGRRVHAGPMECPARPRLPRRQFPVACAVGVRRSRARADAPRRRRARVAGRCCRLAEECGEDGSGAGAVDPGVLSAVAEALTSAFRHVGPEPWLQVRPRAPPPLLHGLTQRCCSSAATRAGHLQESSRVVVLQRSFLLEQQAPASTRGAAAGGRVSSRWWRVRSVRACAQVVQAASLRPDLGPVDSARLAVALAAARQLPDLVLPAQCYVQVCPRACTRPAGGRANGGQARLHAAARRTAPRHCCSRLVGWCRGERRRRGSCRAWSRRLRATCRGL